MHALQRHPARQMATMHTDRCGAASSRPTRTTSTRSPEALLRCTHASRLQRGLQSFGGSHELRAQAVRQEG